MNRIASALSLSSCLVLFAACGSETPSPGADGGGVVADGGAVRADGGVVAADGGSVAADGGSVAADGGSIAADGGSVAADGGSIAADGGSVAADAGAPDAGAVSADAGAPDAGVLAPDAGVVLTGCSATFAGCSSYSDRTTGADTERVINFAPNQYTPSCMRIKAGQSVKWAGTFSSHPLNNASCSPSVIITTTSTAGLMEKTFTFPTAGRYGYWCSNHGGNAGFGMSGTLEVVP